MMPHHHEDVNVLFLLTVESQHSGRLDSWAQPAIVLAGVLHSEVLDNQDPLASVHDLLVATPLWQLLISSVPGDLGAGLRHLADQLHAVGLCALDIGQVLGEPGFFLCVNRRAAGLTLKISGFRLNCLSFFTQFIYVFSEKQSNTHQ